MSQSQPRSRKSAMGLAAVAVIVLAAVAYLPAMDRYFLQDDFQATGQFFSPNGMFQLPRNPDLAFPSGFVPFWTHLADSYFWTAHPVGHHLTNLLVHVLATTAVFVLIRKLMGGRTLVAFFTAVFFGLCPLHENAVGWISGRGVPLAVLFMLITMLAALRKPPAPLTAGLSYALALLCHPVALTTPILVLLLDLSRRRTSARRPWLRIHVPLFGLLAVYAGLVHLMGQPLWPGSGSLRAALEPRVLADTIGRLLVPLNEAVTNPDKVPFVKWGVLAVLLPLQVVFLILRRAAPPRAFWIGLVWLALALIPVAAAGRLGPDLADSRLYYGAMVPIYWLLATLFFADTGAFRQPSGKRHLARAVAMSLLFVGVLGVCLFKNGQAYAGAAGLVRHVQNAALDAVKQETSETWVYIMDPPDRYGGAPVLSSGLRRALTPPYRHAPEARQINVLHSTDTTPLIEHLRSNHPPLKVLWMNTRGLHPRRPFVPISPDFPATQKPAPPFRPPRWAGQDLDDWTARNGLQGRIDENGFEGRAETGDPWFVSPPLVIPTRWIQTVDVRMRTDPLESRALDVDLFWAPLRSPQVFTADTRCRRTLPADGEWHNLAFSLPVPAGEDVEDPSGWLGRVRVDPPSGVPVRIESITFRPGPHCPGRKAIAAGWEGASFERWTAAPNTTHSVEREGLVLRTTQDDPFAVSPILDIPGPSIQSVVITMKVNSPNDQAALYWALDEPPAFREEQSRRFRITVRDGRFHDYVIPFRKHHRLPPGSVLRALRVDPMAGPGTAWIRSIRIHATGK